MSKAFSKANSGIKDIFNYFLFATRYRRLHPIGHYVLIRNVNLYKILNENEARPLGECLTEVSSPVLTSSFHKAQRPSDWKSLCRSRSDHLASRAESGRSFRSDWRLILPEGLYRSTNIFIITSTLIKNGIKSSFLTFPTHNFFIF
jgi:hypothetical protein